MMSDELQAPLTKAEERVKRVEQQRVDAARVHAEIDAARVAQDAKTTRLRALRLEKEASDREAAAAAAVVKKPRRRAKASDAAG